MGRATRTWFAGVLACATLAAWPLPARPAPGPVPPSPIPWQEGPEARAAMDRLLWEFSRSHGAAAESVGYLAATFARQHLLGLQNADSLDRSRGELRRRYEKALMKVAERLPAGTLAAVAADGPHLILSRAYVAALERWKGQSREPGGIDADEEIAAEARDALIRHGAPGVGNLAKFLRGREVSSVGAGGIDRSVYSVFILLPRSDGSEPAVRAVADGFDRGLEAATGRLHSRFRVSRGELGGTEHEGGHALAGFELDGGTGMFVLTDGSNTYSGAIGRGYADGVVVVDARSPSDVEAVSAPEDLIERDVIPGLESSGTAATLPPLRTFAEDLSYRPAHVHPEPGRWRHLQIPVFRMRPPGIERGRRLAEVLRTRPSIRKVAIALPSSDADRTLAVGFGAGVQSLGRELIVLEYEGGRRDYAAEARRFIDSGAEALLFAGPGEESGEWLIALARLKSHPLLLGSAELDPAGFHEAQRKLLDGAIYVGADWEGRTGPIVHVIKELELEGNGADFERGFRLGWIYGRSVVEGSFTATSLARALAERSIALDTYGGIRIPVSAHGPAGGKPVEVVVPLYEVKGGEATPIDL